MTKKKKSKEALLLSEKSQAERDVYFGVLLEHMDEKFRIVTEGQEAMEKRLDTKIESVRTELKEEIRVTQMAVRENGKAIVQISEKLNRVVDTVDNHEKEIGQLKIRIA